MGFKSGFVVGTILGLLLLRCVFETESPHIIEASLKHRILLLQPPMCPGLFKTLKLLVYLSMCLYCGKGGHHPADLEEATTDGPLQFSHGKYFC